jgi:hypothetical protein
VVRRRRQGTKRKIHKYELSGTTVALQTKTKETFTTGHTTTTTTTTTNNNDPIEQPIY